MSTSNLVHPFQCIATIKPPSDRRGTTNSYLLTACGPKLLTVDLSTGEITSDWAAENSLPTITENKDEPERPTKKQKTAQASSTPTNIIKLSVSPDHQYAIIVTDDKCIRVFAVEENGVLSELNERAMPKRPCAIRILPDNATILCGDKFGDVYSLPLVPEIRKSDEGDAGTAVALPEATDDSNKTFKPSASNFTVHTKRNRKALEAQLKQKNITPKTKEPLKFEHNLLLGHVSMLTDVAYASKQVNGKDRGYIITADRDEHIRISRGPPQAHIIEGYCLGHKDFVSKICLVPGTDLLVSGGGDDWLGVWDWPAFKLRQKHDLRSLIGSGGIKSAKAKQSDNVMDHIAVSGIWVASEVRNCGGSKADYLIVACEKESTLSYVPVAQLCQTDPSKAIWSTQRFEYPTMDITTAEGILIISFDSQQGGLGSRRLAAFIMSTSSDSGSMRLVNNDEIDEKLDVINAAEGVVHSEKALDELLYGIANLRKRGYQDEKEDD